MRRERRRSDLRFTIYNLQFMRKYRVAIDVGHARGTGAAGCGFQEHEMCKVVARELKAALEGFKVDEYEADVVDFEEKSNSGDLSATVEAVNAGGYDVCVSLHMDAASRVARYETVVDEDGIKRKEPVYEVNPVPHGAHVCYVSASGKALAREIALRLCPQMPGRAEQVVKRGDLYVLRRTRPVAVLVECGFITNEGDAMWVYEHADKVALSIALGVAAFCEAR